MKITNKITAIALILFTNLSISQFNQACVNFSYEVNNRVSFYKTKSLPSFGIGIGQTIELDKLKGFSSFNIGVNYFCGIEKSHAYNFESSIITSSQKMSSRTINFDYNVKLLSFPSTKLYLVLSNNIGYFFIKQHLEDQNPDDFYTLHEGLKFSNRTYLLYRLGGGLKLQLFNRIALSTKVYLITNTSNFPSTHNFAISYNL